jgi:hypothetical protein
MAMTATYVTVKSLTRRNEGVGHKLYMDNFFSFPDLFDNLALELLWWNFRQSSVGMLEGFDNKTIKLKQDDIHTRVRGF